jgi:hypothetical protein
VDRSFYVYALKDPRNNPAVPFYIGKGVGTRSYDHIVRPDNTRKGERIAEIQEAGHRVLVSRLVDGLSEEQALRIEAELIAAFGAEQLGGMLTNVVMPKGKKPRIRPEVVVPSGAIERAQIALSILKEAVFELVKANEKGVTNAEVASLLGLRSDYGGGSKDYLSYSILGMLMREGKIGRAPGTRRHLANVI